MKTSHPYFCLCFFFFCFSCLTIISSFSKILLTQKQLWLFSRDNECLYSALQHLADPHCHSGHRERHGEEVDMKGYIYRDYCAFFSIHRAEHRLPAVQSQLLRATIKVWISGPVKTNRLPCCTATVLSQGYVHFLCFSFRLVWVVACHLGRARQCLMAVRYCFLSQGCESEPISCAVFTLSCTLPCLPLSFRLD